MMWPWLLALNLLLALKAVCGQIDANASAGHVLMIGGTYFLGKSIAKALLGAGYHLTFITRGSEPDAIAELQHLGASHIKADRNARVGSSDAVALQHAIGKVPFWNAVIDMVAFEPRSVHKFLELMEFADVDGARTYKFGLYYFISTMASYVRCASGPHHLIHGKDPLTSETFERDLRQDSLCKNDVQWAYAMNKWHIDKYLRDRRGKDVSAGRSDPLPFVTVLIPSMVGSHARDGGNLDTRHYELQLLVERCDSIHLHTRLQPPRRYRHLAHDGHLAQAILGMLRAGEVIHGEALNIIMQETLSLEEYLEAIAQALGLAMPQVEYSSHGWRGGSLFADDPEASWGPLSIERAQTLFGYSPTRIDEWMNETAHWWAANGKRLHKQDEWTQNMYEEVLRGACKQKWHWRAGAEEKGPDEEKTEL